MKEIRGSGEWPGGNTAIEQKQGQDARSRRQEKRQLPQPCKAGVTMEMRRR